MANNNPMSTLYMELNHLLNELCKFLSDERNISNSPSVRSQTKVILGKLKHQSKALAQMKDFLAEGESYVEMKGQSTPSNMYVEFENPKDEIYCDITENATVENCNSESSNVIEICPFINKKYSDFTEWRKKGVLSKREKLLFFDTNRKYYSLLYENYLLLYLSKADAQPTHALNLLEFQGSIVDDNRKSFFLINKITKTPYIFFAVSEKDKFQWLAAINSKNLIQDRNDLNRYSASVVSLNKGSTLKQRASAPPEEIYELVEEEEYEKVDNSCIDRSVGNVKAYSKPLPKLPSLPSPPFRREATQPAPLTIRPTSSSDNDDNDVNSKTKSNTVPSVDPEEDHYDIVCAPRIPKNRLIVSSTARTVDLALVHPAVVSALNHRFNTQDNRSPLMKKGSSSSAETVTRATCSSGEYYDSVVGPRGNTAIEKDISPDEEDIYDRVINILPKQRTTLQPQTIDELKSRLMKIHHDKANADNIINSEDCPEDNVLNKPIIKANVNLEKTKSTRRKYIFYKEASATKII